MKLLGYHAANTREAEDVLLHSLWYHLAVVGTADAGLLDTEHFEDESEHRPAHHKALTAYEFAKASANLPSVGTEVSLPATEHVHNREERKV